MSETRTYKREDYGHTLTEPIGDEVAAVGDLSTATVELRVYDRGNIFLSKTASVDSDAQECSYTWQDTDLPNAGEYQAEFFITFSDGDRQRVPRVGWIPIIVEEIDATDAQDPAPPPVFDDHIATTGAGENPHDVYAEDLSTAETDTALVLRPDGSGGTAWGSGGGGGSGDVTGPASSTDNALARYDGTTGETIQNSPVTVSDAGSISIPSGQTVDGRDPSADGAALDSHTADTANPHGTDVASLGVGTLAELNASVSDATLDDSSTSRTPTAHASSHASAGSDSIAPADIGASPTGHTHTQGEVSFSEGTANITADQPTLTVADDLTRLTSDGDYTIHGIDGPSVITLLNRNAPGGGTLTIPHLSGSAGAAGDRVRTPHGQPLQLPPGAAVTIEEHQDDSRWDVLEGASIADRVIESSGPAVLSVGAVADGDFLQRSGSTLVGGTPSGGGTSGDDALIRRDGTVVMRDNGEIYTART